jgi:hypothetical protein
VRAAFAGCLSALWLRTKEELGWTWPHLKSLSGFAFPEALYDVISKDIPFAFSSRDKLMRSLRQAHAEFLAASTHDCICHGLQRVLRACRPFWLMVQHPRTI